MSEVTGRREDIGTPDHAMLVEIADVIDLVCTCLRLAGCGPDATAETELRRDLFELIDSPSQATWERVRERTVAPCFLPGLSRPGPAGLSLAQVAYAFGLPDSVCPSRRSLLRLLRWGVREHEAGLDG